MKKFTSLFLVISMIMCNLNTGVVEALSSYGNKVKSLVDTLTNNEEKKTVDGEEDKRAEKETKQVQINNEVKNTEVVGSTNKETVQLPSDNVKAVDTKNKEEQVKKSSDKKILISDNEGNIQEHVILFYDLDSDGFYYYKDSNNIQKLPLNNQKTTNNNKINLNKILTNNNLDKAENKSILYDQEVIFIITGTGSNREIYFDNSEYDYEDVPFNIVFWKMEGKDCSFSLQNIKSMHIIDQNTIQNENIHYEALTYSFNYEYLNPLNIYNKSSFIAYNTDENTMSNNIVYIDNQTDYPEDDTESPGDDFKESGYSSVVNISFEEDKDKGKTFELKNIGDGTSKKIPTKSGYNVVSILLVSDKNSYVLQEESQSTPYYYKTSNYGEDDSVNLGSIKTKITLDNNNKSCYEISNRKMIEVTYTENYQQKYYLTNHLQKAMDNSKKINTKSIEFIFLGDYEISENDITAIKNYDEYTKQITFKSKVDDWTYLLNINHDIELNSNNVNANTSIVTFDNIKFNYTSNGKCIYANGRTLKFGDDVKMEGPNYPSVLSGGKSSDFNSINNIYLIINSGTYGYVVGQHNNGTLQNINLIINGGTFNNDVIATNGKVVNDVNLTINNTNTLMFKSRVIGASSESDIGNSLNVSINGGTFSKEVIAVKGKVVDKATLSIDNGSIFSSRVIGASSGSDIGNALNVSIKKGTFHNKVIGIDGGITKKVTLTISNGTFNDAIIGASSNATTEKVTLKGLLNRYLFSNNMRITNNQGQRDSSEATGVNINIEISGGRLNNDLIGNLADPKGNSTINIDCNNITIPTISYFTKLVVGENRRSILNVNMLDKGDSTGDLYLNQGSKISFRTGEYTSELNNIVLEGQKNTLVLPANTSINTTEDNVLINLSGELKINNNKLNIEIKSNNITKTGMYLIRFQNQSKLDIVNKYDISDGYYIRDIHDKEDSSGYVVVYPQTTFDLEYNFNDNTFSMIDKKSREKSDVWWYPVDPTNVNLNTTELYQYKGYNLFKKSNEDRNIILTGTGKNVAVTLNNNLDNVKVIIDSIHLTNSTVNINNIKSLNVKGVNTINSPDKKDTVFTYTFNGIATDNKVSFDKDNSYLNIFTNKDTKPFNASEGERIDLKFYNPFNEDSKIVRLKNNNTGKVFNFEIPNNTQRLGLLLNDKGDYSLYYDKSGDTGRSVYVAGDTQERFTKIFKTSSDNGQVYEYVRRANPVSKVEVKMPSKIYFTVDVDANKLNSPNGINWDNHFEATEMKFKNNSTIVEDEFRDEKGDVHHFVNNNDSAANSEVELEYMGVNSLNDNSTNIQLVSNKELDSDIITDRISGIKLALKLDNVEIDESIGTEKSLEQWIISPGGEKTLSIKPNFGIYQNFFNISKNISNTCKINSSHKFTFRYGLKKS